MVASKPVITAGTSSVRTYILQITVVIIGLIRGTSRLRKLACDHGHPCNRCKRRQRKQGGSCVYTISSSSQPAEVQAPKRPRPIPAPLASPISLISSPVNGSAQPPGSTRLGYFGFTSFSAVYEEARHSLSRLGARHSPADHDSGLLEGGQSNTGVLSADIRDCALAVLRQIPSEVNGCRSDYRPESSPSYAWVFFLAKRIVAKLYENWSSHLRSSHDTTKLEEMAMILSANTVKPFSDALDDPDEWIDQFSGPNLRWEALGVVFALWNETTAGPMPRSLSKDCVNMCIRLSRQYSEPNTLLLYLFYRRSTVETTINGDACISAWQAHAQAVSLATFLGRHDEPSCPGQYRPTLASECRRRLFWTLFCHDKTLVAFTGRPPLLTRHYISTPLPLDLTEDELFAAGAETLNETMKTMTDDHGWSVENRLIPVTYLRSRVVYGKLRDEIFEFALGTSSKPIVQLLDLKRRATNIMDELPLCMAFNPDDFANLSLDCHVIAARLMARLDRLQSLFFIERMLLRRQNFVDDSELQSISFDMVDLTLKVWLHRERYTALKADFEWIVMAYGAPAGGILCMELLRPTLRSNSNRDRDQRVTRSAIIQNLSLLVGCLDWVEPSAPNSNLCANAKTMIQNVLDHSLNSVASDAQSIPDVFEWDSSAQVDFNFDLLNTFDWLRPDSGNIT
ncbi:hypothetical protein BJ170DRAFT_223696 [Xylariales sp. AK1849]|nr:hypothetical protein BJ170DRAFT_223696 [Xylariales sp. AK1849]